MRKISTKSARLFYLYFKKNATYLAHLRRDGMFYVGIKFKFGVHFGLRIERFGNFPTLDRRVAEEFEYQSLVFFFIAVAENNRIIIVLVAEEKKQRNFTQFSQI